ncbi:MAG: hypothetical protein WBE37_01465 [Bryobacteraceae bacterium]
MRSVNIAELKNRLSAYLQQVRAGEELKEELALAASGELRLPSGTLNERTFWSIGAADRVHAEAAEAIFNAVSQDREDRDAGLLGR